MNSLYAIHSYRTNGNIILHQTKILHNILNRKIHRSMYCHATINPAPYGISGLIIHAILSVYFNSHRNMFNVRNGFPMILSKVNLFYILSQQLKNSRNEYLKLKARVDNLQRTQRQVLFSSYFLILIWLPHVASSGTIHH